MSQAQSQRYRATAATTTAATCLLLQCTALCIASCQSLLQVLVITLQAGCMPLTCINALLQLCDCLELLSLVRAQLGNKLLQPDSRRV